MSGSRDLPYRHYGVFIPFDKEFKPDTVVDPEAPKKQPQEGAEPEEDPVPYYWTANPRIAEEGFIYVDSFQSSRVLCVQSVGTRQLLINKVENRNEFNQDIPEELRISTAPIAASQGCRLPLPVVVDGVERIHFNELVCWQRFNNGLNNEYGTFSMFFRFCNGGSLEQMFDKYHNEVRPIPEHFIWLVAERLCEAIRYFNFGTHPVHGTPPVFGRKKKAWTLISHRDLAMNNIFIHYHDRRQGTIPRAGLEANAFPEGKYQGPDQFHRTTPRPLV
ncbi:hypothetical protein F4804DRAFT_338610 [Jackrogersella minutella]|nr:hypothetical protein F4804DRAFT_338610 [Jackrogersella minutella]